MIQFLLILFIFSLPLVPAHAKTFREALDQCAGQDTPYCQKVRDLYQRKKAELYRKKKQIMENQETYQVKINTAVENTKNNLSHLNQATSVSVNKEAEEDKSPWGLGYFSELGNIGEKDDNGNSEMTFYTHFDLGYSFRSGITAYIRVPLLFNLAPADDEDGLIMLDPYAGIKGTIWESGAWNFWSRLRLYAPLSQASVDDGVTMGFGTDSSLTFEADWASIYLSAQLRGKFYGFGTDGDRNNGSLSFELGVESIKLAEKLSLNFYYASGFSRKVGQDLGYLVFNDDSQVVSSTLAYKINSFLKISPGFSYNLDTNKTGFFIWFSGNIF